MRASEKQIKFARTISEFLEVEGPDSEELAVVKKFIDTHMERYSQKKYVETIERIKREIAIIDYAEELGFHIVRRGKYYSLKEHDSVMIDPVKNCFWRNSEAGMHSIGKGDSVIGFAQMFAGKEMRKIIYDFSRRLQGNEKKFVCKSEEDVKKKENKEALQLPEKNTDMRKVFAYLTISRCLDREIVQEFVNQKMLYQDVRNNCVFVSYDKGKAVYGCLRGTNTYKRFLGDLPGNDYKKGFFISYSSAKLIVSESVIDIMSVMSIFKRYAEDYTSYDYLALAGTGKTESLYYRIHECQYKEVILAVDNDSSGKNMVERARKEIQKYAEFCKVTEWIPEHTKDWNAELQAVCKDGIVISKIPFIEKR